MSALTYDKQILPAVFEDEPTRDENTVAVIPPLISLPSDSYIGIKGSSSYSIPAGRIDKSIDDTTFIIPQGTQHKPIMRFETTLSVNLFQIKEIFEKVCKKRGFAIVDDEGDQVTAMNKKNLNLTDILLSCIPGAHQNVHNSTAILLHSKTNKITCMRRITLKVLVGDMKLANTVFQDFEVELNAYDGKRSTISPKPNTTSFFSDQILVLSPHAKSKKDSSKSIRKNMNDDIDESIISVQNLQSASFYEFRKILSSDQYSIGKKVADFLKDFTEKYKDADLAEVMPQPTESLFVFVNQITDIFFADFNYGKSETKQMMPYCRTSVEKFVFEKMYNQLFKMYLARYNEEITKFEDKVKIIEQQGNFLEHLKYLDIPQKFWLIEASKLDENKQLIDKLGEHELPYIDAINELRKISSLKSPKEKLGALLMMHSLMKSAVVDFHRGKEEVCSMDEELPILIYILSQANLKNGAAEFNLIDDYVQLDPSLESERRLMTNLKVSLQYIADEWATEY